LTFSGSTASVTFDAQVGCGALGLSNSGLNFDVAFNCGDMLETTNFGIRSPSLNITNVVNTPDPVDYGASFTRTTTICNSGQGALDNFTYSSASAPGLTPTSVTANGIAMTDNDASVEGVNIDVTSAELPGNILNFNGCVDIVETFDVSGCGFLNTTSTNP